MFEVDLSRYSMNNHANIICGTQLLRQFWGMWELCGLMWRELIGHKPALLGLSLLCHCQKDRITRRPMHHNTMTYYGLHRTMEMQPAQ